MKTLQAEQIIMHKKAPQIELLFGWNYFVRFLFLIERSALCLV